MDAAIQADAATLAPAPVAHARSGVVRERLRAATREAHAALDDHPTMRALLAGDSGRDGYVRLLESYAPLYRELEAQLDAATLHMPGGYDWDGRRKLPWLELDLARLGGDPKRRADRPRALRAPIDGTAAVLGVLYPLEGSTLGGLTIGKRLAPLLGIDATNGGRFFHGYGARTAARWAETCAALEILADDDAALDVATTRAVEVFQGFARALDAASAPQ